MRKAKPVYKETRPDEKLLTGFNPTTPVAKKLANIVGQTGRASAEPKQTTIVKSALRRVNNLGVVSNSTPVKGRRNSRNSRSASKNNSQGNSDYDSVSISNLSATNLNELDLAKKLEKYINRIAATCMGQQYSHKYIREWERKNRQNAKRLLDEDAELAAQEALLEQVGFKATLSKVRYSDQRPPTPKDAKKKGNKTTSKAKK